MSSAVSRGQATLRVLFSPFPQGDIILTILEMNGNLSCRCVKTTSDYISPKRYESIEIRPVGSTCRRTEIIIKLKTFSKVCVNPEALWVKKLLKRIASTKKK
nr:PREDICTED: C-X-C motif chemokine 13 isoform X1 [Struthio camelus australis]